MSAKELTIFIPAASSIEPSLVDLATGLSMAIDDLSSRPGLTPQFSARRGARQSLLLLEYKTDDSQLIQEISQWEQPSKEYKDLVLACEASITLYYRNPENAKEALDAIGLKLASSAATSMVENGLGCLLTLSSMLEAMRQESQWSWETYEFPDMPGVASSEWR